MKAAPIKADQRTKGNSIILIDRKQPVRSIFTNELSGPATSKKIMQQAIMKVSTTTGKTPLLEWPIKDLPKTSRPDICPKIGSMHFK